MKKITIIFTIVTLFFASNVQSQSAVSVFQDALSQYENGNYDESIKLIHVVETKLGATNSKIQSLKISIYHDMGNDHNTLVELEKYFAITANKTSSGYEEMKSLYNELMEKNKSKYLLNIENLDYQKKLELNAINNKSNFEKDLFYYNVAKETNTVEIYELFLQKCTNDSLINLATKSLNIKKDNKKYNDLIFSGLSFLKNENPQKAKEQFLSAQLIIDSQWLQDQMAECDSLYLVLLLQSGIEDYYNNNWSESIKKLRYVYKNNSSNIDAKEYLVKAEDRNDFDTAYKRSNPDLMLKYHYDYPNGIMKNQAIAFLFNYNLDHLENNLKQQNYRTSKEYIEKLEKMMNFDFWDSYSKTFYQLMSNYEGLLFSKGVLNYNTKNYDEAVYIFKEYRNEFPSGEDIKKVKSLQRRIYRRWNRKDFGGITISYEQNKKYSLGIEILNRKGLGFYLQLRNNFGKLDLSSMSDLKVPILDEESTFNNYRADVKVDESLSLFMGTTLKIFHPVWLTLGCGAGGYKEYKEFKVNGNLFNVENPALNVGNFLYYPEMGLNIKLGNHFMLKYNIIYSSRSEVKLINQFGLGFSFVN